MEPPVGIGQVGVGYWGSNLLRNFWALDEAAVVLACDRDPQALRQAEARHPGLQTTQRFDDLLEDERVEAVVVATETPQHFLMAEAALRAGKHVFVEKPMAQTVGQAERLVALAEEQDRRLMVGHLLRYHPAFEHVEGLIRDGALGTVHYLYATRVNLGIVRQQENAFESLAPHDLALALAYLDGEPVSVAAQGQAYLQPGVEDVVFATVRFSGGALAHLHTAWLDPHKVRKVTVVGSEKMAVVDDVEAAEKVRVYDKGVVLTPETGYRGFAEAMTVRTGDITIPKVASSEPLRAECAHFLHCVRTGEPPKTDGRNGLAVVRLLEAAKHSLADGGV
ncbi:MAG: Gfo/Idh/MocA family oxidoreductase, partial [Rhodothermales bacterium]|nr:Gfo/Idh/MocA family oxidoreductase [Rhodothermales bacterium]